MANPLELVQYPAAHPMTGAPDSSRSTQLGHEPVAWIDTIKYEGELALGFPVAVGNLPRYENSSSVKGDDRYLVAPKTNSVFVFDGLGGLPLSNEAAQVSADTLQEAMSERNLPKDPEEMRVFVQKVLRRAITNVGMRFGSDGASSVSGTIFMPTSKGLVGVNTQVADSFNLGISGDKIVRYGIPETRVEVHNGRTRNVPYNAIAAGGTIGPSNVTTELLVRHDGSPAHPNITRLVTGTDGIARPHEIGQIKQRIDGLSPREAALVLTNDPHYTSDGNRQQSIPRQVVPGPLESHIVEPGIPDDRTAIVTDLQRRA